MRIEQGEDGDTLIVTGGWSPDLAETLRSGRVSGLVLNYAHGWQGDLSVLRDWPIRRLDILARTVTDISPVYRLAGTLRSLSLTTSPKATLDCARLPQLRDLTASDWPQVAGSIGAAPLVTLGLGGYVEPDLEPLSGLPLAELRLKQCARLRSVDGAPGTLRYLLIGGAPALTSLAGLPAGLTRLRLDTCGGLTSLDELARLGSMTDLAVANCGPIDSVRPLAELPLAYLDLSESTRITDGDLRPLAALPLVELRIASRRHYLPTVAAIKATLGLA